MKRRYLAILTVLLASCARHVQTESGHVAPDVTLAAARIENFAETVPAAGRIGGVNASQTKLAFMVPGVISAIDVHVGERVFAGEVLAALDTRGYELSAAQSRAEVSVARANAQQAQVDRFGTRIAVDESAVKRARALFAAGVAPRKEIEAAQAQLAQDRADALVARTQVDSSAAQLEDAQVRQQIAQRDLQNAALRAPADGVVSAIYHSQGENVDQTTPIFAISPAHVDDVTLSVAGDDVAAVRAGDPVQFQIAGTDLRSAGSVVGASNAIDPATQTATVVARGVPAGAPVGAALQATIVVANRRGIVIPLSAIVQDPQSGNSVTFVASTSRDGSVSFRQRIVKVGFRNEFNALILSGLRPGERVASHGGFALLAPSGGGDD